MSGTVLRGETRLSKSLVGGGVGRRAHAVAGAALQAWAPGAGFLLIASFGCALAVRALDRLIPRSAARILVGAVIVAAVVGVAPLAVGPPAPPHVWVVILPTCAAIAASCQLTARLAAAFERRVLPYALGGRMYCSPSGCLGGRRD